jgi:hypothetical protein
LDYNLTEASDKNFHFFLANATITWDSYTKYGKYFVSNYIIQV